MLYLHAGLHKSGTTSLQFACISNRHLLLEQAVDYPEDLRLTLGTPQHLAFAEHFEDLPELVPEIDFRAGADVFISSEEIMVAVATKSVVKVEKVLKWLEAYFDGLTVCVTLREPQAFLRSLLMQIVKDQGFEEVDERLEEYQSWIWEFLGRCRRFPVKVVRLEDAAASEQTLPSFYANNLLDRRLSLPNLALNSRQDRGLIGYFLGPVRQFYAEQLEKHPFNEEVHGRVMEIEQAIFLSPDLERRLEVDFENFVDRTIERFLTDHEPMYPAEFHALYNGGES